jgi:hypothetical protein
VAKPENLIAKVNDPEPREQLKAAAGVDMKLTKPTVGPGT